VFSEHLNGGDETAARMLAYHGAALIRPHRESYLAQPELLEWHRREVFKGPWGSDFRTRATREPTH